MLILNDIHIGVQRKAGTTPASQEALRNYLFSSLEELLAQNQDQHDLMVLGDLFDSFEVSPRDWVQTYQLFNNWMAGGKALMLVAGNHDWSDKGYKVSSFQMLCSVLEEQWPKNFEMLGINHSTSLDLYPAHIVAHCSNQDAFNDELAEVLARVVEGDKVLLHANYDNNFAVESDHSLNVSEEQALAFKAKGVSLVFAHEHQARGALGGSVTVLGNQWPTSISDCLNNDEKFAHRFATDGSLTSIKTWDRFTKFGLTEIHWRELANTDFNGFVKISGAASSNEAGDVVSAIATFRNKTPAFVVSNSVKIDGIIDSEALPASFEVAKKFDVMSYIKQHLDADEVVAVEKLIGAQA